MKVTKEFVTLFYKWLIINEGHAMNKHNIFRVFVFYYFLVAIQKRNTSKKKK